MTIAKAYADRFSISFQEERSLLDFLLERSEKATWTTRSAQDLCVVPLDCNMDVEPSPGYTMDDLKDILADTMSNTKLMLKAKDLLMPIRNCAVKTLLDRAKITGNALNKVEKPILAQILNHCLNVARGNTLLRISDGKISAFLANDSGGYAILELPELFSQTSSYLHNNFKGCTFAGGFYDHSSVSAIWEVNDKGLLESYKQTLSLHGVDYSSSELKSAVRLSSSDVGLMSATLYPTLNVGKKGRSIGLGNPLKLKHRGNVTMADFKDMLSLLYSQYQLALGKLADLLEIEISNPASCMLRICKHIKTGKKLAYEATGLFQSQHGNGPCTAHDIYYGLSEIVFMVQCKGADGTEVLKMEETVAKALSINWTEYDIPGDLYW